MSSLLDIFTMGSLVQVNTLLGFQMLANMITNVVIVIMFGFYTIAGALDGECEYYKPCFTR